MVDTEHRGHPHVLMGNLASFTEEKLVYTKVLNVLENV